MAYPAYLRAARLLGLLAFLLSAWVSPALACVICVPYPVKTHADLLLETDSVVMARENPEQPFSLISVEVLKGRPDDRQIGLFLDSSTRRSLGLNPADVIVLYRPKGDARWTRLSYATGAYQEVIRDVLALAEAWRSGGETKGRLEFFSQYLTSSDPTIREQAFLEVGRAPYSWITRVASTVSREDLRSFLSDRRMVEWHSLSILMLARSVHPDDKAYIREEFESAARFSLTANLSAWTVAFAEAHPASAIDEIEQLYFRNANRTRQELEAVLQGLSVIASQDGILIPRRIADIRRRLTSGYAVLLDRHPEMAGWVAQDFTSWKRRALVDLLTRIARDDSLLDPASHLSVELYLAAASDFPTWEAAKRTQ